MNKNENDEISRFQDARYVCASESCWRIFDYRTNSQFPSTYRLPVHIEDEQNIIFKEQDSLKDIIAQNKQTPLTHFLKLNAINLDVRDLYYYQMPQYYVSDKNINLWTNDYHFVKHWLLWD